MSGRGVEGARIKVLNLLLCSCAGSGIAVVTSPVHLPRRPPFVGTVLWNQLFLLALRTNVGRENVDFTYLRLEVNF